jgi:ABC-type multidrug transport system, ATPase and permease components
MNLKEIFGALLRVNKLIDGKSKFLYVLGTVGIAGIFSGNKILTSFINKEILDATIEMSKSGLITAVCLALIVFAGACILNPVSVYVFDYSIRRMIIGIKESIFDKLQHLPLNFFQKNHSGDILARINSSVESIEMAYSMHLFRFVEAAIWGIGSLVSMVLLDWRLTVIILVYSAIVLYCNAYFVKKVRVMEDMLQLNNAKNIVNFEEILRGIRIIKIFGIEKKMQEKFDSGNSEYADNKVKRGNYDAKIAAMNFIFSKMSLFVLISIGGYMAFKGDISFGNILAIFGLQGGVSNMFSNMGSIMNDLQGACSGAERVFEILDEKEENTECGSHIIEKNGDSAISISNLSFSYDERDTLSNINIDVKKGEYIAVIGKSGSGKSTLAKLLLGFYSAESGNIKLFGNSSRELSMNEWRSMISYVSQNPILFDGSVRENILYARQNATEKMIIEAAQKAGAHELIMGLEGGYDYHVGENGSNLSGGQKQRIALARAILKDAEIIIIDEGTSALDKDSEAIVQSSINSLKGKWTIIQIIHNLDMIKEADKIYVIEDGKIVNSGKPNEILK